MLNSMLTFIAENLSKETMGNMMYPIGSVYISKEPTHPKTLFGGEWIPIEDVMIIGASENYPAGSTGGASKVSLAGGNLPAHTHGFSATASSAGSHNHSASTASAGAHTHNGRYSKHLYNKGEWFVVRAVHKDDAYDGSRQVTSSAGAHTHSVSVGSSGTHTHSISGTTGATGSGTAHENMPPYKSYYMWERIS